MIVLRGKQAKCPADVEWLRCAAIQKKSPVFAGLPLMGYGTSFMSTVKFRRLNATLY